MRKMANMWIDVFCVLVYRCLRTVVLYESAIVETDFCEKKANMWIDVFYVLVYRSLRTVVLYESAIVETDFCEKEGQYVD